MIRDITIRAVLNGFITQVGCQTLAYTNVDKLLIDLGSYLRDPEGTSKRILMEEGINRKHTMEGNQVPAPMTLGGIGAAIRDYPTTQPDCSTPMQMPETDQCERR